MSRSTNPRLKDREQRALDFIKKWIEANGTSPTLREISTGLGFKSVANAHFIVKALDDAGFVRRIPCRHRSIDLVPQGRVVNLLPDTHFLTARYARKHGIEIEQAANDLLRTALSGVVAT